MSLTLGLSFPHVHWRRPKSNEYPKVWHNFKVKKFDSDDLEEYFIQDLPESRTEDALDFIYCKDEPLCKAYEICTDKYVIKAWRSTWRTIINQKTVLVCFRKTREGSDEIVGINMNYVVRKYDYLRSFLSFYRFIEIAKVTQKLLDINDIVSIYENFNAFEHYGVTEYLTAAGLIVARKYRGRGIGVELLKTREIFCNEFGIKLTLNRFSSDSSNVCADKAGFKLEKIIRYRKVRKTYPHLPQVESDAITLKYMTFPGQIARETSV